MRKGQAAPDYTDEIAEEICMLVAEGHTLPSICDRPGMPCLRTVLRWRADKAGRPEFNELYEYAIQARAERLVDEIFRISDDGTGDYVDTDKGPMFNPEAVQRSRLRVDSRKWFVAKVSQRLYGDKSTTEHTGPGGGPVEMVVRWQD